MAKLQIPSFTSLEEFVTWWRKPQVRETIQKYPKAISKIASHPNVTAWLDKLFEGLQETHSGPLPSKEQTVQLLATSSPGDSAFIAEVLERGRQSLKETGGIGRADGLSSFGRYRIRRKVAEGGFGAVYEAYDPQLDRTVALKLLKLRTEAEIEQFEKEARLVARLRHPNIIAVHELGVLENQPYFTMDFIEGQTLRDLLHEKGRLPVRDALRLTATVADALSYAHSNGIIHRDMKPENVFVDTQGRVYVGDFGVAKQVKAATGMVTSSRVVGTPHYMSPEQANGERLDGRSDVWALGVTLYEMLCGTCPFEGRGSVDIFRKIWFAEPTPPKKLNPKVSRDANTIVMKCLEKEVDRRYTSAAELKEDIGRFSRGEPIKARPIGALEKFWRRAKRNKVASLGIATTLVAVIVVGLILWAQSAAREAEHRARQTEAMQTFDDAKATFENGEYEEALELVSISLTLRSDNTAAQEFKDRCTRKLSEVKKAKDSLARGVGEKDPVKAVELIESALSVMEKDWYARQQYGLALERAGRVDEAFDAFREAAELARYQENTSDRIESVYRMALVHWQRQEFDEAEKLALKLEQFTGGRRNVAVLTVRAAVAIRDGRLKEALKAAEQAFDMDKKNTVALYLKAQALSDMGQHAQAADTYTRSSGNMKGTATSRGSTGAITTGPCPRSAWVTWMALLQTGMRR